MAKVGGPTVKNVSGFDLRPAARGLAGHAGLPRRRHPAHVAPARRHRPGSGPRRRPIRSRCSARSTGPTSLLWDGTTTWALLEGHPTDLDAAVVTARAGAGGGPAAVAAAPPLAAARRPCAGSTGRFVAEIGVGLVHLDEPAETAPPSDEVRDAPPPDQGGVRPHRAAEPRPGPTRPLRSAARSGVVSCRVSSGVVEADWVRWRRHGPARGGRRAGLVRGMRPVPAALPHVPGDRRGGAVAARAHRRHAGGPAGTALRRTGPFVHFMETCVQCRGCEPACPSGVPFGRLMEGTRDTLARHHRMTPRWQRAAFWSLGHHALVLAGSSALAVAQRLHLVPRRLGLPPLPLRRPRLRSSGDDVWLFTGCVMDAWLRPTHAATLKVIEATGAGVRLPGRRRRLLWSPPHPRRASPARRAGWPAGSCGPSRATRRSSSTPPGAARR